MVVTGFFCAVSLGLEYLCKHGKSRLFVHPFVPGKKIVHCILFPGYIRLFFECEM